MPTLLARPWTPLLVQGLGVPALFALAAFYDVMHLTPGPLMMALIGLVLGSPQIGQAAKLWLQERRSPAAELPEVRAALELSLLMREHGRGVVMRAVTDTVEQQRALTRGDDHADR